MRRRRALWGILGILAVALASRLRECAPAGFFSTPTAASPLVGPRQIAENTLGLREYWRVSFGYVYSLEATSGRVVYMDCPRDISHVRIHNAVTGNLLWEIAGRGCNWVTADAERVYFEDDYDVLHVYAVEDGRLLWKRQFSLYRGRGRGPELHGDILYIWQSGGGDDYLYTLDARTGELLSTESRWTADHFLVVARFPELELQIFTVEFPYKLRAIDPATRQVMWQVEERPGFRFIGSPRLVDDLLLLSRGEEVIALDAQSGQLRWRSYDPDRPEETWFALGTGAVIIGDTIYAVREDARLVRMDARTGQVTGYIQFTPPLSELNPYGGSNVVGLAADGQMLFVSFADSQELIALGP